MGAEKGVVGKITMDSTGKFWSSSEMNSFLRFTASSYIFFVIFFAILNLELISVEIFGLYFLIHGKIFNFISYPCITLKQFANSDFL